jgi:hypothetical protein
MNTDVHAYEEFDEYLRGIVESGVSKPWPVGYIWSRVCFVGLYAFFVFCYSV